LGTGHRSIEECRYYLILANNLNYGDTGRLNILLEEVSRLLHAYATAILSSNSGALSRGGTIRVTVVHQPRAAPRLVSG
jgi:hypothetical protein